MSDVELPFSSEILLQLERHKLVKRREEIEKLVMEHEAIKEELLREKEHLKQQLHEVEIRVRRRERSQMSLSLRHTCVSVA